MPLLSDVFQMNMNDNFHNRIRNYINNHSEEIKQNMRENVFPIFTESYEHELLNPQHTLWENIVRIVRQQIMAANVPNPFPFVINETPTNRHGTNVQQRTRQYYYNYLNASTQEQILSNLSEDIGIVLLGYLANEVIPPRFYH